MKELLTFLTLFLLAFAAVTMPVSGQGEQIIVAKIGPVPAPVIGENELIGIYAENREKFLEWLKCQRCINKIGPDVPLLKIVLRLKDTGDEKIFQIKTESELPYESVPTDCPKSEKYHWKKCWFIKYEQEDGVINAPDLRPRTF